VVELYAERGDAKYERALKYLGRNLEQSD